jgi:hypothetical protein
MASARPYPPSAQRIAEARASGLLPHALLAGPGALLLGVSLSAFVLGPRLGRASVALLRVPLELFEKGEPSRAYAQVDQALHEFSYDVALGLSLTFGALVLARLMTQGLALASLRPALSRSLPRAAPSRIASVLWALLVVLATTFSLADAVVLRTSELTSWVGAWLGWLSALTLACLAIDIAFARARFFASLWLTRRDYLEEQRAAFGAPEIRGERERMRRRVRAEA